MEYVRRTIDRAGWWLSAGMVLFALGHLADLPVLITGFMAISLGASGLSLSRWRSERGLWMLSAVMLLLFGATYALMLWGQLRDAFRQQPIPIADIAHLVDFSIGLFVLSMTVKFLIAITILNWKVGGRNAKGAG